MNKISKFNQFVTSLIIVSFLCSQVVYAGAITSLVTPSILKQSVIPCELILGENFNANGKQTGGIQETSSFRAWKDNEIRKARAAAARTARRRAEKAYQTGLANSTVVVDYLGNQVQVGADQNKDQMLASGLYREATLAEKATYMVIQLASPEYRAKLGAAISSQLRRIRINTPNLNSNDIRRAIMAAIKIAIPKSKLAAKLIAKLDIGLKFLAGKLSPSGNKLSSKNLIAGSISSEANLSKTEDVKIDAELLKILQEIEKGAASSVSAGANVIGDFDDYGNIIINGQVIKGPVTLYTYDENGKLSSSNKFSSDVSEDQTIHTSIETMTYDKQGYETGKYLHDTFKGVNVNVTVDTTFNADGSTTSHVAGLEKSEKTGLMEKIDRTSITKTVAINGGFKSVTDTTDNLTGLKSKKTQTYTGVKYDKSGNMSEFNLKTEVKGQRQQDGQVVDIHTVDTIKQYGSKLDGQGRLVSYKQDVWSNSSPAKHTTNFVSITEFDDQDRVKAQVTETWEKGSSVDGAGNKIALDNHFVTYKSNIKYDSKNREVSYDEVTYTQMLEDKVLYKDLMGNEKSVKDQNYEIIDKSDDKKTTAETISGIKTFDSINNRRVTVGDTDWGLGGSKAIGGELIVGGVSKKAAKGYVWGAQNTSRSAMSYNYDGQLERFENAKGDPTRRTYDHLGLIKTENDRSTKTRKYDIAYDAAGRELGYHAKSKQGKMSVYEFHYKEYNTLGQVTKEVATYRGSLPRFHLSEGYETTFTYDKMGHQEQIERKELFDNSHGRTSALQVVKVVVLVVIAVIASYFGQTWTWGTVAAAVGAGVSYGIDHADKVENDQALKSAAITFATILITYGMTMGAEQAAISGATVTTSHGFTISAATVNTTSTLGAQAVSQAVAQAALTQTTTQLVTQTATKFLENWALNTLSGMAQGTKAGDALKAGAIMAFGAAVSSGLIEGISNYSEGFAKFFGNARNQNYNSASGVYTQIANKLVMKYAAQKISEKNDTLTSAVLISLTQAVVNLSLIQMNLDSKDNSNEEESKETTCMIMEKALLQGMAKGYFYQHLETLKKEGKINSDWASFAEGAGDEILNSIDYKILAESLNESVTQLGKWGSAKVNNMKKFIFNKDGKLVGGESEVDENGNKTVSLANDEDILVSGDAKVATIDSIADEEGKIKSMGALVLLAPDGNKLLGEVKMIVDGGLVKDPTTGKVLGFLDCRDGEFDVFFDAKTGKTIKRPRDSKAVVKNGEVFGFSKFDTSEGYTLYDKDCNVRVRVDRQGVVSIYDQEGYENHSYVLADGMFYDKQKGDVLANNVFYDSVSGRVDLDQKFSYSEGEFDFIGVEEFIMKIGLGYSGFLSNDNATYIDNAKIRILLGDGLTFEPKENFNADKIGYENIYRHINLNNPKDDKTGFNEVKIDRNIEEKEYLMNSFNSELLQYDNLDISLKDIFLGLEQVFDSRQSKTNNYIYDKTAGIVLGKVSPDVVGEIGSNVFKGMLRDKVKDYGATFLPRDENGILDLADVSDWTRSDFKYTFEVLKGAFENVGNNNIKSVRVFENKVTSNEIMSLKKPDQGFKLIDTKKDFMNIGVKIVEEVPYLGTAVKIGKEVVALDKIVFNKDRLDPTQTETIQVVEYTYYPEDKITHLANPLPKTRVMTIYKKHGFTSDNKNELQHIKVVIVERNEDVNHGVSSEIGAFENYFSGLMTEEKYEIIKTYEYPRFGEN